METLKEKVAIITGASSGIGEATARALASEGCRVVLAARRMKKLTALRESLVAGGAQVLVVQTDVTSQGQWKCLVDKVIETWGQIDILVNNAGIMPLSFIKNLRMEEWEQMIDVNLKGVLFGVAAVLPHMRSRGHGHIINISSTAGRWLFDGGAVYCATKFAVNAFSEGFRREITASEGIRMTLIEPGITSTELHLGIKDSEVLEAGSNQPPVTPLLAEDIARAVVYAVTQPHYVNVNEILVMPTNQKS
ncbi:MAG: SDR family oxidoreductase [Bacteroidales bacterium]